MSRLIIIAVVVLAAAVAAFFLFGGGGLHRQLIKQQAQGAITIRLTEYAMSPNRVTINHGRVKLTIVNGGKNVHEFVLHDPVLNKDIVNLPFLKPGATQAVFVDLIAFRRYEMYDPTYRKKGMEGAITAR